MKEHIYINEIISISGGNNGEIFLETNDENFITINARTLYNDLPEIIAMTHIELEEEKKDKDNIWNKLGKKILKDYPAKKR